MLDGSALGVLLRFTNGLMLHSDEWIKLGYNFGELIEVYFKRMMKLQFSFMVVFLMELNMI